MEPDEPANDPTTDPPSAKPPEKTSAPPEMAPGLSPQAAARLWGKWDKPRPGERYKPPYSIT